MLGGGSKKESVENMFENKNTENLTAVIVCSFFLTRINSIRIFYRRESETHNLPKMT